MYANVKLKSNKYTHGRSPFEFNTIICTPRHVNPQPTLPEFVRKLEVLAKWLMAANLTMMVTSVIDGWPAFDGSEDGQKKRMVDEAKFAQYILEQMVSGSGEE